MKIAMVQHDIVWEDAAATHEHVRPMIAEAAADGARLIVLTEMFATGFSMHPERTAEDEGGPSEQFLLERAREHDAFLLASLAQRGPDGAYRNNAIVAAPDGTVRRYAKIHPFTFAGESEHYTAGDSFLTVEIDSLRMSVFVCYDLRFADEFWGLAADTDIYAVVANWPEPRREHWRLLLRARAVENQAYVIGVNRVGTDKTLAYTGDSAIIDPLGVAVAECPAGEAVVTAEIDAATVSATRATLPFLQDRRSALLPR
ncbi:MAG TPA: nitrilase-related carbon-nitrogen hydrolase [Jatrophihabitans sp.]|jgi:predicted amidohydrolase